MLRSWVFILLMWVFLSGCQPEAGDISTALQATLAEWTAVPYLTSYPTYTPYPTQTAYPTYTPVSPTQRPESSEMVNIQSGEFLMGCDPWDSRAPCLDGEAPSHTVFLDSFAIDQVEVSNAQYSSCVSQRGCRPPNFDDSELQQARYESPEFSDFPVTYVDWYDARDYCSWVGKRLPNEAEWEKAARGNQDERFYPWGGALPDCSLVNFGGVDGNCPGTTTRIDTYPEGASPYGALNMAGNVREWVADWYDANYYFSEPPENPQGPDSGWEKVLRGGSFSSDWVDIRVNRRSHNPPDTRSADIGFRCASDL